MLSDFAAGVHLTALEEGQTELKDICSFVNPSSFLDLLHMYTIMEDRFKTEISVCNLVNFGHVTKSMCAVDFLNLNIYRIVLLIIKRRILEFGLLPLFRNN